MSNRRNFTAEQKVAIVRRHLIDKVPISELCEEFQIQPTQYYNWQKQLFENAAPAFERRPNKANSQRQADAETQQLAQLQAKLAAKNEVIAELMEENVKAKKQSGELSTDAGFPLTHATTWSTTSTTGKPKLKSPSSSS
jgi:transposase-like protein